MSLRTFRPLSPPTHTPGGYAIRNVRLFHTSHPLHVQSPDPPTPPQKGHSHPGLALPYGRYVQIAPLSPRTRPRKMSYFVPISGVSHLGIGHSTHTGRQSGHSRRLITSYHSNRTFLPSGKMDISTQSYLCPISPTSPRIAAFFYLAILGQTGHRFGPIRNVRLFTTSVWGIMPDSPVWFVRF